MCLDSTHSDSHQQVAPLVDVVLRHQQQESQVNRIETESAVHGS